MSGYHAFHQIQVWLRGEPATVVGKPGVWSWDNVNPGTAALIDVMEVHPTDKVLDLGCGTGLIGLAAARLASEGWTTLVDVNIAAVACARQTLVANGIVNGEVRLGAGIKTVEEYDLALSHLPRGRAVVEGMIQDVATALKADGRFYLVAHKRAGVKSAISYAAEQLGRVGMVRQKQGYHVALAVKERPVPGKGTRGFQRFEVVLDDLPAVLVSQPGVFAWDRVDDGTAALIHAMEIYGGETVLDLGCGAGLLALAAARRGGRVTAVDADLRAIESARRTLEANQIAGEVLISDCAQAVLDRRFDVVLCNPPFHRGIGVEYDVAHQMMRDAAATLRPGGRFYLVSNAFVRYEREMKGRFAEIKEILNDRRYRVLRATR